MIVLRADSFAPTDCGYHPGGPILGSTAILDPMAPSLHTSGGPETRDARPGAPAALSRRASWFLLAFGVWSWFIWVTFARNLWADASGLAFDDAGRPTPYFWVHLLLAVTSFLLGTAVGLIGWRGVRAWRRAGTRPSE